MTESRLGSQILGLFSYYDLVGKIIKMMGLFLVSDPTKKGKCKRTQTLVKRPKNMLLTCYQNEIILSNNQLVETSLHLHNLVA